MSLTLFHYFPVRLRSLFPAGALFCLLSGVSMTVGAAEVNVYSARKEILLRPLLDRFTMESGIRVNLLVSNGAALLSRLRLEGDNSPADLFIATDVGDLQRATASGLFSPFPSESLSQRVPSFYRDSAGHWYGLSLRGRVMIYSRERVSDADLPSDYLDLAEDKWKGRLCVRSSDHPYNQSLVAGLIHHHGADVVEKWARDFTSNFARLPQGGDRDQIRAVHAGECDLALVNTYYLGVMLSSDDPADRSVAETVSVHWSNTPTGVHVNLSGAGILQGAPHRENAIALLNYLTGPVAQEWFTLVNKEYPVDSNVPWAPLLQQWGEFNPDTGAIPYLGRYRKEAVRVMDRAGWR